MRRGGDVVCGLQWSESVSQPATKSDNDDDDQLLAPVIVVTSLSVSVPLVSSALMSGSRTSMSDVDMGDVARVTSVGSSGRRTATEHAAGGT